MENRHLVAVLVYDFHFVFNKIFVSTLLQETDDEYLLWTLQALISIDWYSFQPLLFCFFSCFRAIIISVIMNSVFAFCFLFTFCLSTVDRRLQRLQYTHYDKFTHRLRGVLKVRSLSIYKLENERTFLKRFLFCLSVVFYFYFYFLMLWCLSTMYILHINLILRSIASWKDNLHQIKSLK